MLSQTCKISLAFCVVSGKFPVDDHRELSSEGRRDDGKCDAKVDAGVLFATSTSVRPRSRLLGALIVKGNGRNLHRRRHDDAKCTYTNLDSTCTTLVDDIFNNITSTGGFNCPVTGAACSTSGISSSQVLTIGKGLGEGKETIGFYDSSVNCTDTNGQEFFCTPVDPFVYFNYIVDNGGESYWNNCCANAADVSCGSNSANHTFNSSTEVCRIGAQYPDARVVLQVKTSNSTGCGNREDCVLTTSNNYWEASDNTAVTNGTCYKYGNNTGVACAVASGNVNTAYFPRSKHDDSSDNHESDSDRDLEPGVYRL